VSLPDFDFALTTIGKPDDLSNLSGFSRGGVQSPHPGTPESVNNHAEKVPTTTTTNGIDIDRSRGRVEWGIRARTAKVAKAAKVRPSTPQPFTVAGDLAENINLHLNDCRVCRLEFYVTDDAAPLCVEGLELRRRYREARTAALDVGGRK